MQQSAGLDWPTGKLLNIWKEIYEEENSKDKMAEMDMGDELREIRLGRDRNTKEILQDMGVIYARDIGAIDTTYKLKINEEKNEVCSSCSVEHCSPDKEDPPTQ